MMLCSVMRSSNSIRTPAVIVVTMAALFPLLWSHARAQQPITPPPLLQEAGAFTFTTFVRGVPIGSEQVALTRSADGWTVTVAGRLGAPLDILARRLQVRYTADWRPIEFSFDGTVRGQTQTIHTTVQGATAASEITIAGQTTRKTDAIDAAAVLVLPNSFFGPYEALAARLRSTAAGALIPIYAVP